MCAYDWNVDGLGLDGFKRIDTSIPVFNSRLVKGFVNLYRGSRPGYPLVAVSDEVLSDALAQMRHDLAKGEVADKRAVLGRFVHRIEARKGRAKLYCTFPLAMGPLYECPQGCSI